MKTKPNLLAVGIFLAAVNAGLSQPIITQQPQPCTDAAGTTATFRVVATGTTPLACQWQKLSGTWSDLAGCMESNLVPTNVQTSHAGDYRVAITNVAGATNSDVAHLYVIVPPRIGALSTDLAIPSGARGYFSVSAIGTSPLSYQWCQDGIAIPGATNANLNLHTAQRTNAGAHSVVVTNLAGAITSRMAQLSVAEGWIFTNTQGTRLPYRLFCPPKFDPNAKYPLVLFWHGAGKLAPTMFVNCTTTASSPS